MIWYPKELYEIYIQIQTYLIQSNLITSIYLVIWVIWLLEAANAAAAAGLHRPRPETVVGWGVRSVQCGNMVRFGSIRYCSKSGSGWRSHRWCCTKHIGGVNCFLSFNSDGFWIGRLLQRLVILWPSSACNMLWTIQLGPWRRISLGKLNIYNEYMSHMSDSVVDRLKDSSSAINNPPNSCELVEAFLHVF